MAGASLELQRSGINESFDVGRLEVSFSIAIGDPWTVVFEARTLTIFRCALLLDAY